MEVDAKEGFLCFNFFVHMLGECSSMYIMFG